MLNQQSFWGIYYCLKPFRISLSTAPFYYGRNFQRLTGNVVSVKKQGTLTTHGPDRLAERSLSVCVGRELHSNGERRLNSEPMPQHLLDKGLCPYSINRVKLVFDDLTPNGFDIVVVLFSRVKRPVGDATGNRTPVAGETVRHNDRYTMAPFI